LAQSAPSGSTAFCHLESLAAPYGQVPSGLDWTRSLDMLEGEGRSWMIKRGLRDESFRDLCIGRDSASVRALPATVSAYANSTYARRANDGLVWQGKGLSTQFSAGVAGRFGPITFAVQPLAAWQQNKEFPLELYNLEGLSPYGSAWHPGSIDLPERMGDESFLSVSPGQSHVSLDMGRVAAGASTENLWWGPAVRSPIILGSGAPGFPHVFLGTDGPVDLGFAKLEAELNWGILDESAHYDYNTTNDRRQFSGLMVGLSPSFLPGFHIGVTRAYHLGLVNGHVSPADLLLKPFQRASLNAAENQLISMFLRVAPPGSGFEAYLEWARDDWWENLNDLMSEPEHSQAYTVGFQQARAVGDGVVRLYGELSHFGASTTFLTGRPIVTFYVHAKARQGHTNEGQLLGAPMGPGSNGQMLGIGLLREAWEGGIEMQHVTYDNDVYYLRFAPIHTYTRHDWEFTTLLNAGRQVGALRAHAEAGMAYRRNRNFMGLYDLHAPHHSEKNWITTLQLEWRP
jgi:hypothetical protein